jgi:hypothetical protein
MANDGRADTALQEVRDWLEAQRRAVMAEIRAYPPRITACDLQFNALIESRDRIADALHGLAALEQDDAAILAAFIEESPALDADAKAKLRAMLGQ